MKYETEYNKPKKDYKIIYMVLFVVGVLAIGYYLYPIEDKKPIVNNIVPNNIPKSNYNGQIIDYNGHVTVYRTHALEGTKEIVTDKHNLLVNIGKTFLRTQLTNGNASNKTIFIGVSNSASAPDAAWTIIPSELTTNGFIRNTTATVTNNGTAGFNVTANFTATDTQSSQLTGLYWTGESNSDGNLFAALQYTQQNLLVNDHLEIVWQIFFQ